MSTLPTNSVPEDADWTARLLSSLVGSIALIAAFYIVSMALPPEHKYAGGWIFGLVWFPILVFAFVEFANGQFLPSKPWRAWLAVLEPYVIAAIGIWLGHDSLSNFLLFSGVIAFAGAFTIHPIILYRENIKGHIKESFNEVIVPHLFLYAAAAYSLWFLISHILTHEILNATMLVSLIAGYIDKVWNGIKVSWNA